jgi:DNA-binding transcriptional LysR family regulator
MNLRQIEVFRAVMLAGSISGAASSLHVSSPGISRLLRHLELRLRVSLFERRKGRLVPTPEAQALHAEIERVYQGVRQVQSLAASLHGGGRAVLRVLASANAALQLVPLAVAAVVARHPGAKVYFETLPTAEIVRRLLAEEADVAVCSASIEHPSLDVHDVGHWSLVCALPRGHRLARSRALGRRDGRLHRLAADHVVDQRLPVGEVRADGELAFAPELRAQQPRDAAPRDARARGVGRSVAQCRSAPGVTQLSASSAAISDACLPGARPQKMFTGTTCTSSAGSDCTARTRRSRRWE